MDPIGPVGEYQPADFRRTLEINVVGTLLAVHNSLDALRAGGGSVVTFAGGGATGPLPRFDAYAASKAAVVRLTENLATTLAPVAINAIAPGLVATRLHEQTLDGGPDRAGREFYERTERELEQGGFPPEEAAALVVYLLSRRAVHRQAHLGAVGPVARRRVPPDDSRPSPISRRCAGSTGCSSRPSTLSAGSRGSASRRFRRPCDRRLSRRRRADALAAAAHPSRRLAAPAGR